MTESRPRSTDERSTLSPELLLVHAEQLLSRISDTERPRTVHPRRAVSAAYYAAFHYATLWVAHSTTPAADSEVVAQICRVINHGDVEKVCRWITGVPPPSLAALVDGARSDRIARFADHFIRLKKERELADYSHDVVIDRRAARLMVGRARDAIAALDALDSDDPSWRAFVSLVLLQAQPGKRGG